MPVRLIVLVGVVVGWEKEKEERKGRRCRVEVKEEGRHAWASVRDGVTRE